MAQARARRDFLIHLVLFVPGAGLLILLVLWSDGPATAIRWLLGLWLLGLALHGLSLLHPLKRLSRLLDRLAGRT